ncbi:MAG: DUF2156 domain-containing protein [Naasia sp.]
MGRHPVTAALDQLRRHAVTAVLALLVLAASIVSGAAWAERPVLDDLGVGIVSIEDGRGMITPFASLILAFGWGSVVVSVLGILVFVGLSEQIMGWWRTLFAFVVTGFVGALGGAGLQAVGFVVDDRWAERVTETPVLDPLTAVAGTILTASAFAEQLWRRRIRVVGFAALLLLVLYVGTPADGGRLVAGLAGLALGTLLSPPSKEWLHIPPSSHHEARTLLSALTLLMAVGPLVTIVSRNAQGPLHPLAVLFRERPPDVSDSCSAGIATRACLDAVAAARVDGPGPILLSVLPLLLLALAAWALARGRRAGVWIAASLLVFFAALTGVFYGILPLVADGDQLVEQGAGSHSATGTVLAVLVPAALACVLLASRKHFPVRSTARARTILGAAGIASLVVGAGTYAATIDLDGDRSPSDLLLAIPERYIPVGFLHLRVPADAPDTAMGAFAAAWIGPVFWAAILLAAVNLVIDSPHHLGATDLERLRSLLRSGSSGSIGHMATWPGNSYWFAPGNRAAVAYRIVADVALTLGGPIGPAAERSAAVHGFARFCEENGWIPAFYSVDGSLIPVFDELGWPRSDVGDDAVILPAEFSLAGGRWKDIRTSINRAGKAGVRAMWTSWGEMSLGERNQLRVISEEWVAGRDLPEMGFTLGGIDELADPDVRLMLAVEETGTILAATSWMPTWCDGMIEGWTLDFMRRRGNSMNGVMEFLIAQTVLRAQAEGTSFVSLSAAPLAGVGSPGREGGVAEQVLGYVGRRLESLYGFRSLLAFKEKFGPQRRPLFIAYPDPLALPAIGMALTRSYLPSMTLQQIVSIVRSLLSGSRATTEPDAGSGLPAPKTHEESVRA